MKLPGRLTTAILMLAWLVPAGAPRAAPAQTFGDARLGFFANEREARDRTETSNEGLRLRLRVGAETRLSEDWLLRGRFAGRFSTDQERTRFWLRAWAPTRTGLEDGDGTLDELYLRYAPAGADWSLRVGRFQSKFELTGVASKSMDRNDSPNMEVTWTDGWHWQYALTPQWRSHLILQRNASRGTGQAARAPLAFDDRASRITTFAALESTTPIGPLKQRLFGVTWMPGTLATDGIGADRREDYFALTAKLFAEWPIGPNGMRGGLGGEIGYAPNTPVESVVNAGAGTSADGWGRTFSMNLLDFMPGHHIAFVFGRAGAGWLISPDFRNNDRLLEIRYQWRISRTLSMESRLRRREEIDLPEGVTRARIDDDFYLRFSTRF
jgi:hypothetical protein